MISPDVNPIIMSKLLTERVIKFISCEVGQALAKTMRDRGSYIYIVFSYFKYTAKLL